MRFEAQTYKGMGTEGVEMSKFLNHYFYVTKFLLQFNADGFRMGSDVRVETRDVTLSHNVDNTILHSLGMATGIMFMGRVGLFNVRQMGQGRIVLVPKLLTTDIVNLVFNQPTDKVMVSDPALFQVGDSITIGGLVRKITNIIGGEFTLDANVMYDKVYVVSLATETAKAIVF